MRVVVTQFATSSNTQENLATCIRMIDESAACEPSLIVLPEYCNTQFCNVKPGYVNHNQSWDEALVIDGNFINSIAAQAKKYGCYIVLNITLRRDDTRAMHNHKQQGATKSNISVTSCLLSPDGEIIHQQDKKTLTEHEKHFFVNQSLNQSRKAACEVIKTPFGKLGLLSDEDSFTFETSRNLALNGAQLLCHSMNSITLDQYSLYDPTRSCENNVFIAAANKVGSLLSEKQVALEKTLVEQKYQDKSITLSVKHYIPHEYLIGVGRSQILSTDGRVLAEIANDKEGYTFADIDLSESGIVNKFRPDGTQLINQLRPELYRELASSREKPFRQETKHNIPLTANVAIFATYKSNGDAIEDVCHYIDNNLSDVIQLPELFFFADKNNIDTEEQLAELADLSQKVIKEVSLVLRPFQYVCTSLVIEGVHQAVLINEHGLFATQQQLHFCQRYHWTTIGNDLNIIQLPLEQGIINVVMLTADDANIPEIVNVVAVNNIHLLLVPFDIQEPSEVEYSLISRAAENRVCIVAASREKSFINELAIETDKKVHNKKKIKPQKSTGFIANLTTETALITQLQSRKLKYYTDQPIVKHQHGKITKAVIFPIAAKNRLTLL